MAGVLCAHSGPVGDHRSVRFRVQLPESSQAADGPKADDPC